MGSGNTGREREREREKRERERGRERGGGGGGGWERERERERERNGRDMVQLDHPITHQVLQSYENELISYDSRYLNKMWPDSKLSGKLSPDDCNGWQNKKHPQKINRPLFRMAKLHPVSL